MEVPVEVVAVEPPVKVVTDPVVVEPPIEELVDPVVVEPFVIVLAVAMVGLMFRGAVFEIPPLGGGVTSVTCTVPGSAMSLARTVAVSCVADTYDVVRGAPLTCISEESTKFVPATTSVNAKPPAVALVGLMLVIVGAGS